MVNGSSLFVLGAIVIAFSAGAAAQQMGGMQQPGNPPGSISRNFSPPPSYDSIDQPGPSTGNYATPEADGRPGEYYFQLGVNAYNKNDYAHAIEMYKVAASWAYKPAEFNLGLIYFQGLGVPADKPRGAAWMSLAAERGDSKKAEQARDLMLSKLDKSEADRAFAIWQELKPTYGDEVALHRAKMRWAQVKANKTGSRVGDGAVHLLVSEQGESVSSQARPGSDPGMGSVGAPQATSAADFFKSQATDSSIVYQQFERSGNPYDVRFRSDLTGTVAVGSLTPVQAGDTPASAGFPVTQARSKDDLASLQLFGAQSQANFQADLACTSKTALSSVQCATVQNDFEQWASARQIALHSVSKDDPAFTGKSVPADPAATEPYYLAILFEPVVTPSLHNWTGTFNTMSSSYTPGSVGYQAEVFVYATATGELVRKVELHERHELPDKADATPAMKSQIQDAIARIDPAYLEQGGTISVGSSKPLKSKTGSDNNVQKSKQQLLWCTKDGCRDRI